MRLSSPIEALSSSIGHAVHLAMSDVIYFQRDFSVSVKANEPMPGKYVNRRPFPDEIRVRAMFPQLWGSTALGFGGIGGAAMTEAYTVVLQGSGHDLAVYFQGCFAYRVNARQPSQAPVTEEALPEMTLFFEDIAQGFLASVKDAKARYGAVTSLGSLGALGSLDSVPVPAKMGEDVGKPETPSTPAASSVAARSTNRSRSAKKP